MTGLSPNLAHKQILLGISGSIAAYKAASLCRLFIKAGAEVKIVMTADAAKFITPLTLSTLCKHPVHADVSSEAGWNNHVELGLWADAMIIAPCTANTLAKLANGICDNMVCAAYLSARCPVFVAPAMDVDMWHHPSTQANIQRILSYGNHLIPVGTGELASGLIGEGRMAEPENIVSLLDSYFGQSQDFLGKKVLVTAGPTQEKIDPVRFIGNHSSGKMGCRIAEEFAARGAEVVLVLGPSSQLVSHPNIQVERVRSAEEMYQVSARIYPTFDVAILAAAVADYRPKHPKNHKIKKKDDGMFIELERTVDIAATLGKDKKPHQLLIGFAMETENGAENAKGKLVRKNFDFIVLNTLGETGAGFQVDTNKVSIIRKDNIIRNFGLKSKANVAADIADEVKSMLL